MSGPVGDNVLRGSGVVKAVVVEGGLDVADQWRQNANAQMPGSGVVLFDGIAERVDTAGQGTRGSAMSVSSGVWTFPETGIWSVFAQGESNRSYQKMSVACIALTILFHLAHTVVLHRTALF